MVSGMHRVHLLTMSTGKAHPKSSSSSVVYQSAGGVNFTFAIQVCNRFLGILFIGNIQGSNSELVIWNWHTGAVELVRAQYIPGPRLSDLAAYYV